MEFYTDPDRMIQLLRISLDIVPGNHPMTIDMGTGFMGAGKMKVEMDFCPDRRLGSGIKEDAAAAEIEAACGKVYALALHGGADHAGTPPLPDAGKEAPSNFEETVAIEGFKQNSITTGKVAVILFSRFAGHDNRDVAQFRVGLDLQTTLRPRHAGDFLGKIDKLRSFRATKVHGLGGALRFEKGHGNVAQKLLLDSQEKTGFVDQKNFCLTLFHALRSSDHQQ
jgi:hypothetical protein